MNYHLTKNEKKIILDIEKSFYMPPTVKRIIRFVESQKDLYKGWEKVFDEIYAILLDARSDVEEILKERKQKKKIKDISQSMKSIAGNTFSNAIMYIFLKNKIVGNINPNIFITSKKSQIKNFENIATIHVDGETQKPDIDLVIYTKKENGDVIKCMILSLKTSLRERAGQTYKWKLLMEIATSENKIKEKYNISYNPAQMPLICFATVNFYDEINNPQHRGMFKFFDKSFIAKEVEKEFISPLSYLISYVNQKL